MQNSVRKIFPLAIALLLALCGAAVAGDNANVNISLASEPHVTPDGGEEVEVVLSADGLVGVKQFEVTLAVSPANFFDLEAATFTSQDLGFAFFTPQDGQPGSVERLGGGQIKSGAAINEFDKAVDGSGTLGIFTLKMSDEYDKQEGAEIWVTSVSLGPSSEERDVLAPEMMRVIVNWPVVPATLTSPTVDYSYPYSPIGSGVVNDSSPGELEFSVDFRSEGNLTKGQTITWDITNSGRSVYYLASADPTVRGLEIPSGAKVSLRSVTDANGNAVLRFDSEGNLKAIPTSLGIKAHTKVVNPAGAERSGAADGLGVDFNATWAVPENDLLMFVDQISLTSENENNELVADGGAEIPVVLSATGLGGESGENGVRQVEIFLEVSNADHFDLEETRFESAAFSVLGPAVEVSGRQVRIGAVVNVLERDPVIGEEALMTVTLVTAESFNLQTEAEIVVKRVSLGPLSSERDVLDDKSKLLELSVYLNRPDPMLVATEPLVGNALTSGADTGVVDDDSPGEITYSVNFTNLWGDPGEGQRILWDVYNRSAESVSVLGIGTIPSHGSAFVRNATDADGNSSIEVDAEVVSFLSITASTATENTAGKALDLAVDFSAAWAAAKPLAAVPLANSLSQNYPNPFNPETTIRYDLSSDAIVSLTIYNIAGQVVRKLVDGESLAAGQYQAVWDGRSESGASVASGMYFYLLHAGDYVAKRKMVLLR